MNKNGSKIGEHITVINENLVNENERRPMCIHGPTLLFKKTFDNGTEPIQFYACSAFRNPKECPILKDEQVILNRAQLQVHSKAILGLAEVNNVFSYDIYNLIHKETIIFTLDRQTVSEETCLLSYVFLLIHN